MNQNIFIYKTHNGAKKFLKWPLISNCNWDQLWKKPHGKIFFCHNVPMPKHPWCHNIAAPKFFSAVTSLCHMSAKPKHNESETFMATKCLYRNVSCQNARCQIMPTYLDIVMWILVILNWNATSNQLWLPFAKCFDMLSAKITRQKSVFEIWRQITYLQNEYPQNKIPLNIFANSSIGISSFPIIVSQQSIIFKNMKVSSENIKWKHDFSDCKCRKKYFN